MISTMQVAKLLGRAPSQVDMDEIHRVQLALQARDDDAILLVAICLQTHQQLLRDFPTDLAQSISKITEEAESTARLQLQTVASKFQIEFSKTAATAAQQIAADVSRKSLLRWLSAAAVTITACIVLTGLQTHEYGYQEGFQLGLREARDERAAASWANTDDGRKAYSMHRSGSLHQLSNCGYPGWQTQKNVCFPGSTIEGKRYGYRLP